MAKQQLNNNKSISLTESNRKVKNLLLQGWRNRWSAPEFATYLKQQLSIVSVSGDQYELSKLILQQATVGRQPVILFVDYLHHLLSSGVVSFGSVINSIIETCKIENTQVVICLLDFLITQENNINCFASEQDCLDLASSLAKLINFIFNCLEFSLRRLNELSHTASNQQNQHEQAIEKCSNLLSLLVNNQLLISLIYVGLIEENEMNSLKSINFSEFFDQKEKLFTRAQNNKSQIASHLHTVTQFIEALHRLNPNFQAKKYLQFKGDLFKYRKSSHLNNQNNLQDESILKLDDHLNKSLISLNCVITFDAILNPKAPSTKLAHQLYDISVTNHLKLSLVCCELIKFSFINFADSISLDYEQSNSIENKFLNQFQRKSTNNHNKLTKESIKWAAFIYFKMPLVLKSLKELAVEKNRPFELEKGLEKFIKFTPLIEILDHKTDSDCLANLFIKLVKLELVDEQFQQILLKKKDERIDYFNNLNSKVEKDVFKKQPENLVQIQGQILLNKAEPLLGSIFSSLNPESASKPENLVQVFVKMISSNSIEIILNTSTYTGQLHILIKKVIYWNEFYTHALNEENSKQAALRANLFDISFLVLCYIVQEHGQEIILNCLEEEGVDLNSTKDDMEIDEKVTDQNSLANSFFVKFCLDFLPESLSKVNYDEKIAKCTDPNKIDGLLSLFSIDNFDYQLISWDEVLLNVIGVFKELLQAYLANHLSFDDLSVYLLNMTKRNCSIGVVIAFYAVNYMNMVGNEQKKKIILILKYLSNSNNFVSCFSNQTEAFTNYKEKHTLALKLINNLINDQIAKTIKDQQQKDIIITINNDKQIELYKVLKSIFLNTIRKGWLNSSSIYCFDKILSISGATWFMDKLIKLLLYECEIENMFEGVELICGLSTLDMQQCCLALLNVVIPQYLVSHNDQTALIEPRLTALCKLISYIIFSVLELDLSKESSKTIQSIVRRHCNHYVEDNFIEYESGSNEKKSRPIEFLSKTKSTNQQDPIFNSIARLLRLVSSLLTKQKISQRTTFSLVLLEQLVFTFPSEENVQKNQTNDVYKLISSALTNKIQIILQYLPFDTILNLVRIFPNEINYDLLLSICNLQSSTSRKLTANSLCQLSRSKISMSYPMYD